jgi:hypothetical protein
VVDAEARDRIMKSGNTSELEKWLVKAATAKTTKEIFGAD